MTNRVNEYAFEEMGYIDGSLEERKLVWIRIWDSNVLIGEGVQIGKITANMRSGTEAKEANS